MADEIISEIYLLHAWIRQISPMIWRRLMVRSDSTLAALHDTFQIVVGWTVFRMQVSNKGSDNHWTRKSG